MTDVCQFDFNSVPRPDRLPLIREAFRLEWLTIEWTTIEAVVSIGAGFMAGSLIVLAFGLDSLIELASAGVLMWRLSVELRYGQRFSERAEHIATRIGGTLLFLLAAYVLVSLRNGWRMDCCRLTGNCLVLDQRRARSMVRQRLLLSLKE